ncbi:MAG TPA: 3-oxoadipyl-CoA thiolase [Candidatus Kapabacteria bacterium]|nr:3-oxoadipyl-CoA thiolase [Candidatus Kapabacteria bacterium]
MNSTYIIDGIRTGIGKYGGTLSSVRPDDMAALTIREIIQRNSSIDPSRIDEVILGCANQAGEDNRNIARMSLLLAGLPHTVPGETVNRLCASGMSAIISASRSIIANDAELVIAGGVESMSRSPFVLSKNDQAFGREAHIFDTSIGWRFVNPKMDQMYGTDSMGNTAENVAEMYNIDRQSQDEFAYRSQLKANEASKSNKMKREIIDVQIQQRKGAPIIFNNDEFIRADTNIDTLSKLKPAFKQGGTVTAGNSSGINDGAAALLIGSENAMKEFNLAPMVRIVSSAVVGVEPRIMGIGPVEASKKAIKKAGLTLNDIDVIELNEAFAAQSLACIRELGLEDFDDRINPNGGAIALGHPLGMSGARIILSAAYELIEKNKRYALATMCIGVGQGYATIIENVNLR